MKVIKEGTYIKIATRQRCPACRAVLQIEEEDLYANKINKILWYKCPCCKREHIPTCADENEEGFFTNYREVHSTEVASTEATLTTGTIVAMVIVVLIFLAVIIGGSLSYYL